MSSQKKPNWFWGALRNAFVSQAVGVLVTASGGAGAVIGVVGYLQGLPWAQLITFSIVGAAGMAALIHQGRRVLVDANLANKFYVQDVQLVEEIGEGGVIIGYIPWILLHNLSDIPIHYRIDDLSGNVNRFALFDITKIAAMSVGHVQAQQEGWHGLGVILMPVPDSNRVLGTARLRISFGKTENYLYDYKASFDFHVLLDELGAVQLTRAFRR